MTNIVVRPQESFRMGQPDDPRLAQVVVGAWWRVRDGEDPVAKAVANPPAHGVIFPILAVHTVDGSIHSVEMHRHPTQGAGTHRMMLADLLDRFEHEPQGAALRAAEQAAVLGRMGEEGQRLAAGPDASDLVRLTPQAPALPVLTPNATALPAALTGGRDTGQLAGAAERAVAAAEAHGRWAQERATSMQNLAKTLGAFQGEQVAVVKAQAEAQGAAAHATLQRLSTLTLFLGERQKVTLLVDGASAPADIPLHFFQGMLFLDEELAVSWPEDEGFTWKSGMGDLGAFLSARPDLVARMLPQPRAVAIARIRRHPRALGDVPADWVSIFQAVEEQEWDRALIILVRDGGRLFMIEADEDTANAQRLFPSKAEIDALYRERGWYGSNPIAITPGDLDYVKSRAAHDARALFYKRFLVLFWGLHAREGLFGPFMPTDANWFSPDVQAQYFRFVHDEEHGLEAPGPRVWDWMENGVAAAGVGAMLALDTDRATANGVMIDAHDRSATNSDHRWLKGKPVERFAILPMESNGMDRFVRIPMLEGKRVIKRSLMLTQEGRTCVPPGVVPMEIATVEACDRFLASRRDRVRYQDFVPLLRALRPILVDDEANHTEALSALKDVPHAAQALAAARAGRKGHIAETAAIKAAAAIGKAIAKAKAPALIDPKGAIHQVAPWRHPRVPDLPTGLCHAGGTFVATHHPAPAGWTAVGTPDWGHKDGLHHAFSRIDLPRWIHAALAPAHGDALAALFEGQDGDGALALVEEIKRVNRASRARLIETAPVVWTLGLGTRVRHGTTRLAAVAAVAEPTVLLLASRGEDALLEALTGFYRNPKIPFDRAKATFAQSGAWQLGVFETSGGITPPEPGTLDWKGFARNATRASPKTGTDPLGSDGGALLAGTVNRPSEFLFGGPNATEHEAQAKAARFWMLPEAKGLLAPYFGPGKLSWDGVDWAQPAAA